MAALLGDDLGRLKSLIDHVTFDALWAQELRANATARVFGLGAAEPLYQDVLQKSQGESDHLVAADVALALGDVNDARRHIEQGAAERMIEPVAAIAMRALIDLVKDRGGDVDALREHLQTLIKPHTLRGWAYVRLPVLALAWAKSADVVAEFETLRHVAEERLASVVSLPPLRPRSTTEEATSTDDVLDDIVRQLLSVEEGGGAVGAEIEERLRRLAGDTVGASGAADAAAEAARS